jgi:hypothetical protein
MDSTDRYSSIAANENPDRNTRAALCIILLLILLAMSSCSMMQRTDNAGNSILKSENGYIENESKMILVVRYIYDDGGKRTLVKRSWGLDGRHFEQEEEYLAERPDLVKDLLAGQAIAFYL